jgi:signal transduction histidine kinase
VKARLLAAAKSGLPLTLAVGMAVVVLALVFSYYRVVREWRRSSIALVNRAADDSAQLLVTALTRDMRGAQMLVLANRDAGDFEPQQAEFSTQVATAFTRLPYPESFFAWRKGDLGLMFFNRGNRQPRWVHGEPDGPPYPVVVIRDAPFGTALLAQLKEAALNRSAYTYVETSIENDPYQIVARLEYSDPFRDEVTKITGFTVNLSWVREKYFPEIVAQVARIKQSDSALEYSILDDAGRPVVGLVPHSLSTSLDLPLQFFDAWTVDLNQPDSTRPRVWKVSVSAANDPTFKAATRGLDWTLVVITVAALTLALSFLLMARAVQTSASLTAMRADFVATVTHHLKTPLATIRAVADTMMRQPLNVGAVQKYAGVLTDQSSRLSRLVDNMLAYARVTDVTEVYSFEDVCLTELLEDALLGFRQQLVDGRFEVTLDIPADLPSVRGDRTALRLAVDNLIDNAVRYCGSQHWIRIAANRVNSHVVVEVGDRGVGIPQDEIKNVLRRFVRGSHTHNSGTGLGLAIVQRVAVDHAGRLELLSEVGKGTTARFEVPVAKEH